jgi:hypothetical protein
MGEETDWVKIRAGKEVEYLKLDGTRDKVRIKAITLKTAQQTLEALKDPIQAAQLFTGKTADWCEQVQPDSLFAIVEEGVKLNEPFFRAWKDGMERVGKTLTEMLGKPPGL